MTLVGTSVLFGMIVRTGQGLSRLSQTSRFGRVEVVFATLLFFAFAGAAIASIAKRFENLSDQIRTAPIPRVEAFVGMVFVPSFLKMLLLIGFGCGALGFGFFGSSPVLSRPGDLTIFVLASLASASTGAAVAESFIRIGDVPLFLKSVSGTLLSVSLGLLIAYSQGSPWWTWLAGIFSAELAFGWGMLWVMGILISSVASWTFAGQLSTNRRWHERADLRSKRLLPGTLGAFVTWLGLTGLRKPYLRRRVIGVIVVGLVGTFVHYRYAAPSREVISPVFMLVLVIFLGDPLLAWSEEFRNADWQLRIVPFTAKRIILLKFSALAAWSLALAGSSSLLWFVSGNTRGWDLSLLIIFQGILLLIWLCGVMNVRQGPWNQMAVPLGFMLLMPSSVALTYLIAQRTVLWVGAALVVILTATAVVGIPMFKVRRL